MKKLFIFLSALLVLFISGCTKPYPVDETAFKKIAVKSKFLTMNTCYMAHITSKQIESEIKNPSYNLIGGSNYIFKSDFVIANCALTDKQFIAYYTKEKGKIFAPLISLDYKDIKGAGIESSDAFAFGYQLQLKTKKGVFGITLQNNKGGFARFDKGAETKKYLNILKVHGVKDFKLPKRLYLRRNPYWNNMHLIHKIYYPYPNIPFLEEACDMDLSGACNHLGILAARRQDYSEAKKYFRKGCDLNDDKVCKLYKELISNPIEFTKKYNNYIERISQ